MARPQKISDERLLTAAGLAISRLGPAFTLADVAREAQVAAGTLVRRFGSKHGLLMAMTTAAIESTQHDMRAAVAATTGDPVTSPIDVLVRHYSALDDPESAANNLAQLAFDLADEELRALMAEFYAVMEAELSPLLSRAVATGDLPGAPPVPVAARVLTAVADGTAIHWSARPVGRLSERLRTDLGAIVDGWRRKTP